QRDHLRLALGRGQHADVAILAGASAPALGLKLSAGVAAIEAPEDPPQRRVVGSAGAGLLEAEPLGGDASALAGTGSALARLALPSIRPGAPGLVVEAVPD